MAKNAATAKAAHEATTRKTTSKAPAEPAQTGRTSQRADATASAAPRAARGTGAGAKAAAGRSTRTPTRSAASAGGRSRAPAHPATATAVAKRPDTPPVPPGTDWTADELAEVRTDLERELAGLRSDYDRALADITRLQQSSNDGAGDDQADAGSKTFEREQELSIANNRRDLMVQMERAMERLEAGTYGRCESCGEAIPKARLQAFPGATLCVRCKQREERR